MSNGYVIIRLNSPGGSALQWGAGRDLPGDNCYAVSRSSRRSRFMCQYYAVGQTRELFVIQTVSRRQKQFMGKHVW